MITASFITGLFLLVFSGGMDDFADDALLQTAESAFHSGIASKDPGHFQRAAEAYTELLRRGYRNADLYRCQGNCWLLAGDLPRAILAYRQGLVLAPADAKFQDSLQYARSLVVLHQPDNLGRPFPEPSWSGAAIGLPAHFLFSVALLLYAASCLVFTYWWTTRNAVTLTAGIILLGLSILFASLLAADAQAYNQEMAYPIVVISQDGVVMRKGNGLSYPRSFDTSLNKGAEGRLFHIRGEWLQIELSGGEIGWIPRSAALVGA